MSTAQLPFMPVNLASLMDTQWFMSGDAELLRAGWYLLDAAWRSSVPGSVPSSFSALTQITRLSEDKLQSHYDLLLQGWDLREDGRLHHVVLSDLASGVIERFGTQLEVLAQSAAVCMQSVEEFDLVPTDAVKKVAKKRQSVKGRIEDFQPDSTSLASVVAGGYRTAEHQEWLVLSFKDYIASKNPKYKDIQATFRTFAASSFTHNSFRSRFGVVPSAFLKTDLSVAAAAAVPASAAASRSFAARSLDENRAVLQQQARSLHLRPTKPVSPPSSVKPVVSPRPVRMVSQGFDGIFDFSGQS